MQSFLQGKEINYWTITYDLNRITSWSQINFAHLAHLGTLHTWAAEAVTKLQGEKPNQIPF